MTHQDKVLSIIDKKYHLDDITKELILEDEEVKFDSDGNCWWWEVYKIDGEYFQVFGHDDYINPACRKVEKKIRVERITYWE